MSIDPDNTPGHEAHDGEDYVGPLAAAEPTDEDAPTPALEGMTDEPEPADAAGDLFIEDLEDEEQD